MLANLAEHSQVYPVYIEAGLVWEQDEKASVEMFLAALAHPGIEPVTYLSAPVGPLLDSHWSVKGQAVPGAQAPDSEMFIPGRNVLLIALTAVWCSTHVVGRIAIGSLGGNPFPDSTPEFFESFASVLSAGLGHEISVEAPFRGRKKADLIRSHSGLPLELTLTCANPAGTSHCGDCNKCTERRDAFQESGVEDRTKYLK